MAHLENAVPPHDTESRPRYAGKDKPSKQSRRKEARILVVISSVSYHSSCVGRSLAGFVTLMVYKAPRTEFRDEGEISISGESCFGFYPWPGWIAPGLPRGVSSLQWESPTAPH